MQKYELEDGRMIDYMRGTIRSISQGEISILPQGLGISYQLTVAQPAQYAIGHQVELYCYQYYTQDHGFQLFGFTSQQHKDLFLLVLDCAGIGPKMALVLVDQLDSGTLLAAIAEHNTALISKVPGIGPKKAEQLLLYLKHKTERLMELTPAGTTATSASAITQVSQALAALGYKSHEVQQVVGQLYAKYGATPVSFDELMRAAFATMPMVQSRS